MINKNREYYSKKGKKIYADFLTFASSDTAIAKCTAKHFLQSFKAKTKKYSIAEFGVGNGNFAYQFLDYITKKRADLDISYSLFDFSKQMLKDAQKRLLRFKKLCNLIVFDAERDKLENFKFDFVVMNELISDLKVELHSKNCLPRDRKKREIVLKFLDRLEDNRKIPFNFKACNFLTNIFANLNSNGFIHVFDYGFYHRSDILDCDIDIWNSFICREYGQQITCDVN
ncbi:MAG: class I SAM-dependent methyltransferase, partial [Candidatus Anstonellales archaeon]